MTNIEIANAYGNEQELEIGVFQNPSYEGALLGFSDDGKAVYDYELMVRSFMLETGCSEDEAHDFVSSDTCSAYFGPNTPIIIFQPVYLQEHNQEMLKKIDKCYYKSKADEFNEE